MLKKFAAIITLLVAAPVSAEFTPQEKAQVLAQVESLYDAGRIYTWASDHLRTRPQDAPQISTIFSQVTTAHESHTRGLLYLLDQEGGDSVTIDGMTRAQARQAGINGILGVSSSYVPAIATINSMTSSATLDTAKMLLNTAETKRIALNTSLAYEEPRVAENVAMPGATRLKSANAGPHGDYRRFGELILAFEKKTGNWIRSGGIATVQNPAFLESFRFIAAKMNRAHQLTPVMAGMAAGVEHLSYADDVDIMFASGTSRRSRHFWRMTMVLELLLGWDHGVESHPFGQDVFGRPVARGLTYELTAACRESAKFIRADSTLPAYVKTLNDINSDICESWSSLDGLAQNALVFRYFTNTGPPGQVVGVCGANTTLEPGPPPTCVGTDGGIGMVCGPGTHAAGGECLPDPCPACPPQNTCGTGTHLVGSVCEADLLSCPLPQPELVLVPIPGTPGFGVQPVCVVQ